MFYKIFLFEIQNRVRRPAVYLYFTAALVFTILSFATGSLPAGDMEHFNSPYLIAMWCAGVTMLMMVITSSIMGTPLYRDIEYSTKDYYLTYPITKAGYFWGRFLGSFVCMLLISTSILFGVYFGSKLGPAMHWRNADQYGPNRLIYYLYPYFTIALPNLVFTSCLFFGLVAITRNVKVIYSGGIILFLGYFISIFFLGHTNNVTVITLADPFALNGIRYLSNMATSALQNTTLLPVAGLLLLNRIIWSGVGLVILLYTYLRFNFERFFSGRRDKSAIDEVMTTERRTIQKPAVSFSGNYNRNTLISLVKMELNNIIRDNYFWIILSCGLIFLGFVFWMGDGNNGVPDFPRTVVLLDIFNDVFLFFIFFIIIFYSGETLHRDRTTRYAFINDSLPPPNWVLNGSKLITLLLLGFCLSLIPLILGVPIQIARGFYQFNFPIYFSFIFTVILPRLLEMVLFAYLVQVTINNKFAAHGVGIFIWVALFFLHDSGLFNYNLLLYSYTPWFKVSDMDGLGHMAKPVYWFNIYWLLCGGLFIIVSALFYYRGVTSSFKERLQLAGQRFERKTRLFAAILLLAFLGVAAYNYYNVSYLNTFFTKTENDERAILYEKKLKRYASLPLPSITRIKMNVDLFPDQQQQFVKAWVTMVNRTHKPIVKLLLDGDNLSAYNLKINGRPVPFSYPLFYERGVFNFFRPRQDTADFRLYRFEIPLAPGDSAIVEVNSYIAYKGFRNGLYAANMLHNGTIFTGGLPGIGYDDDDEINSAYVRKLSGLPPKKEEDIAQDDPVGVTTLKAGEVFDSLDITVSTPADQTAVGQGTLQRQWKQNGRNYYHYLQTRPGVYAPIGIVAAKYAEMTDSVVLDDGHEVNISLFFHPAHTANVGRFMAAYKEGIRYFSKAYGDYPFTDIRLAETPLYGPWQGSLATLDVYNERFGWNADFTDPNQDDYCYFTTVQQLAQQWWRFEVAPNSTAGSLVIPEGLARYGALIMTEKKYGKNNMRKQLQNQLWSYLNMRRRQEEKEHPLIRADQSFEWGGKAGVALYGLRDLIGEDSLNAALRDFKKEYAFRNKPPFAGANDLYRILQKHVPDSLQYYLRDTWQKITLYDNKVTAVKAVPSGNHNSYKVTLTVNAAKVYIDDKGRHVPAKNMNDYINIGVFAAETKNKAGRSETHPIYLQKYKLTAGQHTLTVMVKGKPAYAAIDPYNMLIDAMPNDNIKNL